MAEEDKTKKVFSLSKVMESIQRVLAERCQSSYWVKAEMIKLNYYPKSGHCYPDLVEKKDGKIVAQARAVIWKDDYLRNNARFQKTFGEPLKEGGSMLFLVKITFEATHGVTLRILEINTEYTLGDMEREKRETIKQLQEEKIFDRNRSLKLPLLPQRIAIISVETSRGYKDFLYKTMKSPFNFFHVLFPSLLQGELAIASISEQLKKIRKTIYDFDAVAIIRGGGGDVALSVYNNYQLAREIATFPIPVITGIGHATNKTVVEMVACRNSVTPTDLADFLIQQCENFLQSLRQTERKIIMLSHQMIERKHSYLQTRVRFFHSTANSKILLNQQKITQLQSQISEKTSRLFTNKFAWLEKTLLTVRSADPDEILRRGYSLTLLNGRIVKDISQIKKGDTLKTIFAAGSITSTVKSARKRNKNGRKSTVRKRRVNTLLPADGRETVRKD